MREALFYNKKENEQVQCQLCPHHCLIQEGKKGSCNVRENKQGKLYALTYNKPISIGVDPIEKKPLYHFLAGEKVFSFGTIGCNLDCEWCQNHDISHPEGKIISPYGEVTAEEIIKQAEEKDCSIIAFTYNEPTIFYEYLLEVAKLAKKNKMKTVLVSNGFIAEEPLTQLLPYIDAANIDLKGFNEVIYRKCTKGILPAILKNIKLIKEMGVHLELTTLIVPEVNDSEKQIKEMRDWIVKQLGKEQIIHLSRFFPYYKSLDKEATPLTTLEQAAAIVKEKILFAYLGNIRADHNTYCPQCKRLLISREIYQIINNTKKGKCSCGYQLPGIWK